MYYLSTVYIEPKFKASGFQNKCLNVTSSDTRSNRIWFRGSLSDIYARSRLRILWNIQCSLILHRSVCGCAWIMCTRHKQCTHVLQCTRIPRRHLTVAIFDKSLVFGRLCYITIFREWKTLYQKYWVNLKEENLRWEIWTNQRHQRFPTNHRFVAGISNYK